MSVTSVQVQLPSFSHSFPVSVPSEATILDFKNEISRTCIGSPSTSGQRIIYKGRVLGDSEVVGQVWKATEEPHTCHLAVHPSAWTSTPPGSNSVTNTGLSSPPGGPTPPVESITTAPPPGAVPPLAQLALPTTYPYIQYMHTNALRILARQPRLSWPQQLGDMEAARALTKRGIESTGRGWPPYLNQDFPPFLEQDTNQGVMYSSSYIDNLPYLCLQTPDATPTPIQTQAIRVLSYTFPLLCLYVPSQGQSGTPMQVNVIPPYPPAPLGVPARGQFLQIPIRRLLIPLLLLTIRTTLLLYFFQPARKPLFGVLVMAWVTWELVGALRRALAVDGIVNGDPNNRANAGAANAAPAGRGVGEGAGAAAGAGHMPGNNNNNNPTLATGVSHEMVLNHLAHINIAAEAPFVQPDSTVDVNTPPPGMVHKVKTFFTLLILTLHPAIWDRRRTALRRREGHVREAARTLEARALQQERELREREENQQRGIDTGASERVDTPPPPPPPPKPFWVAEYIQRVRSGDWVDE